MSECSHVVRRGIYHQPALLETKVATGDPARLAHERVGAVGPDQPPPRHRAHIAGEVQAARLLLDHPADRQRDALIGVDEPLGHPPTLDAHVWLGARVAVDRPLQLGLEEHVIRLPPRRRQALHIEAQQQLAVGPEPLAHRGRIGGGVVVEGGSHARPDKQAERKQQR